MPTVVGDTIKLDLSWQNLNVYVKQKRKILGPSTNPQKHIINNVTGYAKSGELLVIMGASGAGKTTLLNILTGRHLKNLICLGNVCLNGIKVEAEDIRSNSAYVQQEDLFLGTLTVREHLRFQAAMRIGSSRSKSEREERVEEVLKELGLSKCADTMIGSPTTVKAISGGQKKRLAFASEIITNPSILFCDEPTSGLDSFTAGSVVSALHTIASNNRTVISTIHQPSSEMFEMFDKLLLLAEGRVAFLGKTGDARDFFASAGYVVPTNYNPADFYIAELAIRVGNEAECRQRISEICDHYEGSQYAQQVIDFVGLKEDESCDYEATIPKKESKYAAPIAMQCSYLLWRSFLTTFREPLAFKVRVLHNLIISFFLGLVYFGQSYDQKAITNINGAMFLIITNLSYPVALAIMQIFTSELPIFLREYNSGLYRVSTYFFGKITADLPNHLFLPILFASILYWMAGLRSDLRVFLTCCFISMLIANTSAAYGYFISALSGSTVVALSISPPIMIPLMLFGGLFINSGSIPRYLQWVKYISWYYYAFESLIINQWDGVQNIHCGRNSTTCLRNGSEVIKQMSFTRDNFNRNIFCLLVSALTFRFLAFITLYTRAKLSK